MRYDDRTGRRVHKTQPKPTEQKVVSAANMIARHNLPKLALDHYLAMWQGQLTDDWRAMLHDAARGKR